MVALKCWQLFAKQNQLPRYRKSVPSNRAGHERCISFRPNEFLRPDVRAFLRAAFSGVRRLGARGMLSWAIFLTREAFLGRTSAESTAQWPFGAIISPVFVGAIADRYLSTQLVIGGLHLVGAVLLLAMSRLRNARPFYWTALVYSLAYSPTLALVNSIVFANIPEGVEAESYFPLIRVFGTIGWILAGLSLKLILKPNEPVK